ncbi:MAG: hypothetical protein ACXVB9_00625 [Bdellovibrionota bacterium]
MRFWGFLTICLALPAAAFAGDGVIDSLRQLEDLNRALNGEKFDKSCWMDPETTGKNCNATSDEFCRKLFDEGDGNMAVFDGEVRAGTSEKSGLSLPQLDDYRALVSNRARLPKDLAKKAGPALDDLKRLIDHESDSKEWSRKLADANRAFANAVDDVQEARGKSKRKHDADLKQEIVNAKYLESENWKRVQRLFPEAKEDLLKVIDSLNISDERKAHMKERVSTVELVLPSGADDCGTTQLNAFYTPETHKFTVCAGLFNAYATDSGLFQTIAHEISHSIDNNAESLRDYRNNSPVGKTLNRLVGAKGPVIACDEWNKLEEDILSTPAPNIRRSELDNFYGCLENRSNLKTWTIDRVGEVADIETKKVMSSLAKDHAFLSLAQPTFTEQGELKPNPQFMRPDLIKNEADDGDSKRAKVAKTEAVQSRDTTGAEIFTQVLACEKGAKDFFPKVGDPKERRELFHNALNETASLIERQKQEYYSFCGQTCDELVASGYSHDPSENYADWMANRATRFLYARIDTPEHRQESAALGNALLCDEAGPKRDAPGLAAEEKRISTEEHPDDRIRRISEYDAVVAHQLGCTLSPNQGFAPCEP